jgi:hypothetical protein
MGFVASDAVQSPGHLMMSMDATALSAESTTAQLNLVRFLEWGDITYQTPDYAIIRRYYISNLAHPHNHHSMYTLGTHEYGIGCFSCGKISWNLADVNARSCQICNEP